MDAGAGTTALTARSVFVDDTGRRQQRFRRGSHTLIALCGCYLALVIAGVTGHGPLAGIRLPLVGGGAPAHVTRAMPPARGDAPVATLAPEVHAQGRSVNARGAAPSTTRTAIVATVSGPVGAGATTNSPVAATPNGATTPVATPSQPTTAVPSPDPPADPTPTGPPSNPPGQSGSAPGQSGSSPGQSGTTPGQSGTTPADGAAPPGKSTTTPGQTSNTPGQSASATHGAHANAAG